MDPMGDIGEAILVARDDVFSDPKGGAIGTAESSKSKGSYTLWWQ